MMQGIKEVPYDECLKHGDSFSVRVKMVASVNIDTLRLEREIGRIILEKRKNTRVNLVNPDKRFLGFVTGSSLIFGLQLDEVSRKRLIERIPGRRPFIHPSTMSPKLARCLVNLVRTKPGSLLLDPFCGAGSILLEAGDMGYRVLGSDINVEMVRGSLRNLKYFGIPFVGVIVGDARSLPFESIDCIVSDPPYGRASSTFGLSSEQLVSNFLSRALLVLRKGGHISLALPDSFTWRPRVLDLGYELVEEHWVREHKSLTRDILIIKKP